MKTMYLNSATSLRDMLAMRYFCSNVTHLRNAERITKKELAEITGISSATIGKIENGKETEKLSSVGITLAAVFCVPLQALYWEDLSYLPCIKDRYLIEFERQFGSRYADTVIDLFMKNRALEVTNGAYDRDKNRPSD